MVGEGKGGEMSYNFKVELDRAEQTAQDFVDWKVALTQMRAIFSHLRAIQKSKAFDVELKLFLARMYYKSNRKGQSVLHQGAYKWFKEQTSEGTMSAEDFDLFTKVFEAIVAYTYGKNITRREKKTGQFPTRRA